MVLKRRFLAVLYLIILVAYVGLAVILDAGPANDCEQPNIPPASFTFFMILLALLLVGLIGVIFARRFRWALFLGVSIALTNYAFRLAVADQPVVYFLLAEIEPYVLGALVFSLLQPEREKEVIE
jgi:hypothetical protein